jgi:ribosomal-protein-alanine N-acetyltransferase
MALPHLDTARLSLRPVSPTDEDALHALFNDATVRRYLWDDRPVSRETVREVIAASLGSFEAEGFGLFLAHLREGGAFVGFTGLRRTEETREVELLYGLWPTFSGQGLATEMARAGLRFGFEEAGLDTVVASADVPNLASFRVMERLGMRFLRDTPLTRTYVLRRDGAV